MDLLRATKDAINRRIDADNAPCPKGAPRFVEPTAPTWVAQHRSHHPKGYYRLHCAHDKPLWETCSASTCKRNARTAQANLVKLLNGTLY